MSWLEDLQDQIETDFGLENGVTLFAGFRSDDAALPAAMVLMTEYQGDMLEHFGSDGDLERPNLQLLIRGAVDDYPGPRDRAWALQRYLRRIIGRTIGSTLFISVMPVSKTPNPLGKDAKGRFSWTIDFQVTMPGQ